MLKEQLVKVKQQVIQPDKLNIAIMKETFLKHRELIVHCILAALVFLYGTYRLSEVGQPILFDDEFGYWTSSSFFLGIDWKSVTSRIGYYSYGYGLLLVPIRIIGNWFGWGWKSLYQAAVVLNTFMLVGGYLIAIQLSKRYFNKINWFVRDIICFTAIIYPSNIVFSHITWTENTLTFFFWVFLYVLMRCIDKPSVKNHIMLACTAFYLYVVHQRALSVLLTGVVIVLFLNLLKVNKWKHLAAFLSSMYICSLVHSMIKGKLQNDFYLGNAPADFKTTIGYAFNTKAVFFFVGIVFVLFILYLADRGKSKLAAAILSAVIVVAAVIIINGMGGIKIGTNSDVPTRIANNDFAGQLYKIKGMFTIKGFWRLLISMVGKWFYLVAGTGLIICWGMKNLIKNIFFMFIYSIRMFFNTITGKKEKIKKKHMRYVYNKANLWLLGVCLAWISTFMVNAIYKEGFYKVDDLVNGRYNEYIIGILLIYSVQSLLEDKKWIRTLVITLILYLLAGVLCQHAFDEVGRTDFELCHSVMFGRVFWNWEVPAGKIKEISEYVLPMGLAFIFVVKLCRTKFPKIATMRCIIGLMIPILAWSYLTGSILENYVVSRNEKQAKAMPDISMWVNRIGWNKKVYYLEDTQNYRWAEGIQFMLQDEPLILTNTAEVSFDEDALFIMNRSYLESDIVKEKCEVVAESGQLALVINKEQEVMQRLERCR